MNSQIYKNIYVRQRGERERNIYEKEKREREIEGDREIEREIEKAPATSSKFPYCISKKNFKGEILGLYSRLGRLRSKVRKKRRWYKGRR